MKNLLKLFLFLYTLCMAGCKEDPQSVSFSFKEHHTGELGEILTVTIEANCPWTLSESSQRILIDQKYGTGSGTVRIKIDRNRKYEDLVHQVTVTSGDGTSTDILTIIQEKSFGLKFTHPGELSEEGGSFTIPIKTNDEITKVETPEWITCSSTRGLTDYIYTFVAQPNQTGSPRKGSIKFRGNNISEQISIEQDSYAPTAIALNDFPSVTTEGKFDVEYTLVPDYADVSKLRIEKDADCSVTLGKSKITVVLSDYGEHELQFLTGGEPIARKVVEYVPLSPFKDESNIEVHKGKDRDIIDWEYFSNNYVLETSDESVVKISYGRLFKAVGLGTATISAYYPGSQCRSERTVTVVPFTLRAGIRELSLISTSGLSYLSVSFSAVIGYRSPVEYIGFRVTDRDGNVLISNEGATRQEYEYLTVNTVGVAIMYQGTGAIDLSNVAKEFRFTAIMNVDGETVERTVGMTSGN